jgi:hypothetical protein
MNVSRSYLEVKLVSFDFNTARRSCILSPGSIFVLLISLISGCSDQSSPKVTGESLARTLIQLSEHGTQKVELKQLADKVCFVPEGLFIRRVMPKSSFRISESKMLRAMIAVECGFLSLPTRSQKLQGYTRSIKRC